MGQRHAVRSCLQYPLCKALTFLLLALQAARTLLTLDDKDTKRLFEGEALLRRMYKYGLLEEGQNKLDYVLALTPSVRPSPPGPGPGQALIRGSAFMNTPLSITHKIIYRIACSQMVLFHSWLPRSDATTGGLAMCMLNALLIAAPTSFPQHSHSGSDLQHAHIAGSCLWVPLIALPFLPNVTSRCWHCCRTSWSAACRRWCSSWGWRRAFTMRACSSASATSGACRATEIWRSAGPSVSLALLVG